VWTGTGKAFFFNPTTRLSIWVKPDELQDNDKVDEILEKGPPNKQESEYLLGLVQTPNFSCATETCKTAFV
jgi:hypothetical protein